MASRTTPITVTRAVGNWVVFDLAPQRRIRRPECPCGRLVHDGHAVRPCRIVHAEVAAGNHLLAKRGNVARSGECHLERCRYLHGSAIDPDNGDMLLPCPSGIGPTATPTTSGRSRRRATSASISGPRCRIVASAWRSRPRRGRAGRIPRRPRAWRQTADEQPCAEDAHDADGDLAPPGNRPASQPATRPPRDTAARSGPSLAVSRRRDAHVQYPVSGNSGWLSASIARRPSW